MGTNSLLFIIYGITLIKVVTGSRYLWLIQLIAMLIVYNLTSLAASLVFYLLGNNAISDGSAWIYLGIVGGLNNLCFNIAHWMFAFSYYQISRRTPHALNGDKVPPNMVKRDQTTNRIFFSLNVIVPIVYGVSQWGTFMYPASKLWFWINRPSFQVCRILQLISGAYLFCALNEIKKFGNNLSASINLKTMTLHAVSFGLYMLSIVIVFIVNLASLVTEDVHATIFYDAFTFVYGCSFIA